MSCSPWTMKNTYSEGIMLALAAPMASKTGTTPNTGGASSPDL